MKKTAVITGCTSGLGKNICLELSKQGYDIIGTYNTSIEESNKLKNEIQKNNVNCDLYKVNLLNEEEITDFCNKLLCNHNKINVLINNAALSCDNNIENKTKKEFVDVLSVNLVAPFLLIQKLNKILDTVINISSTDGINTYSIYNIDYSASKAGLINLTRSLSLCYKNIKFICICPNWINTESIKEMNQEYLKSEMERINQKKLIEPIEISNIIKKVINEDIDSGSVIVLEDSND